jgi:hypothetical protein
MLVGKEMRGWMLSKAQKEMLDKKIDGEICITKIDSDKCKDVFVQTKSREEFMESVGKRWERFKRLKISSNLWLPDEIVFYYSKILTLVPSETRSVHTLVLPYAPGKNTPSKKQRVAYEGYYDKYDEILAPVLIGDRSSKANGCVS